MPTTSFEITAVIAGLTKALGEAKTAVNESVEQMRTTIETLNGAFESVQKAILGVTAILAGGEIFKDIIESTTSWGESNIALQRALGITGEKAATYQVALQHLGISNDVLIGASDKLSKQIYTNSAAFEKAGIATKDSGGHFRAVGDILQDVTNYLNAIHDPIERNIAGMQFFGKGWASVRDILKLSSDEMLNAAKRAQELGLATGTSKEQIEAYQHAMNDVKLTVEALQYALGKSLLPTLTNVANAFAENGSGAIEVFSNLLKDVAYVAGTVAIELEKMGKFIGAWVATLAAVGPGFKAANKAIGEAFDEDMSRLNKEADELWDKLNRPLPKQDVQDAGGQGPHDFDSKEADKSRVGEWQTELEEKKAAFAAEFAAEGQLREVSKQQEIAYWQAILETTKTTLEERKEIRAKIAADELAIDKARLEGSLASLKNDESAHANNLQARMQAEMKYADAVKGIYGADSKEYAEAQAAIVATKREEVKQEQELDAIRTATAKQATLSQIATEQEVAKARYDMGAISMKQLIALEKQYEDQKYALELQALQREQALVNPNDDPVKYAQMLQQIQTLETQHNSTILKLDQQLAQSQGALWKQLEQTLTTGMAQAFEGIIERTETVRKAFTKLFASMLDVVLQFLAKQLAQFLVSQAEQLIGIKTTGTAQAGQAAAAAMASVAAIPVVGWALAPEVGDAIFAEALGFASAARGYDIPRNINPVTQLHGGEMVLPQRQADVVRNLANQRGGGGANFNFSVSAMNSRDVKRALQKGGVLEKEVRRLHRRVSR